MKRSFLWIAVLTAALSSAGSIAGDTDISSPLFPDGITLGYGAGLAAVKDEYISKEKYSGGLPVFQAQFARQHDPYIYFTGLSFRSAADLKNHHVSTKIIEFTLNQGFLYPLRDYRLFSRQVHVYMGPMTELFAFVNDQEVAVRGFDYSLSVAALISLGLNTVFVCPLSKRFHAEGGLEFGILSLGLRMVDLEETDVSPVKLLTLFSGTNGTVSLGVRYFISGRLSAKADYMFGLTRISAWDPLLIAHDTIQCAATFHF
ncbi:hypothetical protein JW948_14940 [bacterium]|nr:hypothetical protein [bacterium]